MADQKRWFKVWVSILDDPHFQELSLEDIGRWTLLGALTAFVGTKGRLRTPASARRLRETLRMNGTDPLKSAIERLPSVMFEEGKNRDGDFFVTWKHWSKYQRDAFAAERMKTLRSKRRGEENKKRREKDPPPVTPSADELSEKLAKAKISPTLWAELVAAIDRTQFLCNIRRLHDPLWWGAQLAAYGDRVDAPQIVAEAEAYLVRTPAKRVQYRDLARFLGNWMAREAKELASDG